MWSDACTVGCCGTQNWVDGTLSVYFANLRCVFIDVNFFASFSVFAVVYSQLESSERARNELRQTLTGLKQPQQTKSLSVLEQEMGALRKKISLIEVRAVFNPKHLISAVCFHLTIKWLNHQWLQKSLLIKRQENLFYWSTKVAYSFAELQLRSKLSNYSHKTFFTWTFSRKVCGLLREIRFAQPVFFCFEKESE